MDRHTWLKLILWAISLYHFFLGGLTFLSPDLGLELAKNIFDMNITMTVQLGYISKILGVYACCFGLIVYIASTDTNRFAPILNVVMLLYAIRVVNRLIFFQNFQEAFGTSDERMWLDIVLLAFFGLSVFYLSRSQKISISESSS